MVTTAVLFADPPSLLECEGAVWTQALEQLLSSGLIAGKNVLGPMSKTSGKWNRVDDDVGHCCEKESEVMFAQSMASFIEASVSGVSP